MKRFLFFIFTLMISTIVSAQAPKAVDSYINEKYGESYKVISVDTVAMPIRIVMSMRFALAIDGDRAVMRANEILEFKDPANQLVAWLDLEKGLEKSLGELVTIEDVITMRNSNTRHEDDYYNYQRTTIYLNESQREETLYVRLGEESVSMTQMEYNELEAETFLMYWNLKDFLKSVKKIINTY